jgi:hypothetical protein
MLRTSLTFSACLVSALISLPAHTQTDIDQAAALAGGVSACDTPGFPVTICDSGSYRLTSDLDVSSGTGIIIQAYDIAIDLNGFTIRGTTSAATTGISINGGQDNTTVINGSITDFTNAALSLWTNARLEKLALIGNGSGVTLASGMIRDSRIIDNAGDAIRFSFGLNSHVQGNIITTNQGRGIWQNNTFGGLILDNTIGLNSGLGLELDTITTYGNNNLYGNNSGGTQATGGQQMGINLCNGSACP